jgi:hypothetical protein
MHLHLLRPSFLVAFQLSISYSLPLLIDIDLPCDMEEFWKNGYHRPRPQRDPDFETKNIDWVELFEYNAANDSHSSLFAWTRTTDFGTECEGGTEWHRAPFPFSVVLAASFFSQLFTTHSICPLQIPIHYLQYHDFIYGSDERRR